MDKKTCAVFSCTGLAFVLFFFAWWTFTPPHEWLSVDRVTLLGNDVIINDGYYVGLSKDRKKLWTLYGWIPIFPANDAAGKRVVIQSSEEKGYLRIIEKKYVDIDKDAHSQCSCDSYKLPDNFYICVEQDDYEVAISDRLYIESENIDIRSAIKIINRNK